MKVLFVTDLHGNRVAIEQALSYASECKVNAVIFGGDITPKKTAIYFCPRNRKNEYVIPLANLRGDSIFNTYTESLKAIKAENSLHGPAEYAHRLSQAGTLLCKESNQFFAFEQLFIEQKLLDKLVAYFRDSKHNSRVRASFSSDEFRIIADSVVEWMKLLESEMTNEQLTLMAKSYAKSCGSSGYNPKKWLPSRHILECLVFNAEEKFLHTSFEKILETIPPEESTAKTLLTEKLEDLRNELFNSIRFRSMIEPQVFGQLVRYTSLELLKTKAQDMEFIKDGQAAFLKDYFLPTIQAWRNLNNNVPVLAMLGNDDHVNHVEILEQAHQAGIISHLYNRVVDLSPRHPIIGYSPVSSLPSKVTYRDWEKSEEEILTELRGLRELVDPAKRAIWSIHNPPFECLDTTNDGPVGSKAVREFILETQPPLALFGHIHEAARLGGSPRNILGHTICINPGAEHHSEVATIVIDLDSLHSISPRRKGELTCPA